MGLYEIENTDDSTPITSDSEDFSNMIKVILENNKKISHLVEIKDDDNKCWIFTAIFGVFWKFDTSI